MDRPPRRSRTIAACDWSLANKGTYNIKVANFSLNAGGYASVLYSPLDAAVEKLWLQGIVVVVSNGNFGPNCETTTDMIGMSALGSRVMGKRRKLIHPSARSMIEKTIEGSGRRIAADEIFSVIA